MVEALACRRALYFVKELSIFEVSVEGDSEVIIKAILAGDVAKPKYGHVINDILFVANDFRCRNFSHVKCIGNSVAHFLAKKFGYEIILGLGVWILKKKKKTMFIIKINA